MHDTRPWYVGVLAAAGALLFAAALASGGYSYVVGFDAVAPAGSALWPGVLYNVTLFSLFAMHHSLLARSGVKHWLHARVGPALERVLYVILASGLFLWCCLAWEPLPGVWYTLLEPWRWIGLAVQGAGVVVTVLAARAVDLRELAGLRTPRQATGAPLDRPLETHGVYGWVRHPMYLGWLLLVAGAPVMTATRGWFAVTSLAYLMVAIPFEERSLAAAFGPPYRAYQRTVRWRMLPGVY